MKRITANDPEPRSADVVAENLECLKALFPEAFTEGKVDFEALKQLLGGEVDEREENYGSTGTASAGRENLLRGLRPEPFVPARRRASIGIRRRT